MRFSLSACKFLFFKMFRWLFLFYVAHFPTDFVFSSVNWFWGVIVYRRKVLWLSIHDSVWVESVSTISGVVENSCSNEPSFCEQHLTTRCIMINHLTRTLQRRGVVCSGAVRFSARWLFHVGKRVAHFSLYSVPVFRLYQHRYHPPFVTKFWNRCHFHFLIFCKPLQWHYVIQSSFCRNFKIVAFPFEFLTECWTSFYPYSLMKILETVTLPPPIFSRNFETAVIIHCHIYDFEKNGSLVVRPCFWKLRPLSYLCSLFCLSARSARTSLFSARKFCNKFARFWHIFHVILTPTARFFGAERPADSIESCTDAMRFV